MGNNCWKSKFGFFKFKKLNNNEETIVLVKPEKIIDPEKLKKCKFKY